MIDLNAKKLKREQAKRKKHVNQEPKRGAYTVSALFAIGTFIIAVCVLGV